MAKAVLALLVPLFNILQKLAKHLDYFARKFIPKIFKVDEFGHTCHRDPSVRYLLGSLCKGFEKRRKPLDYRDNGVLRTTRGLYDYFFALTFCNGWLQKCQN